jgi:hypothetical protein
MLEADSGAYGKCVSGQGQGQDNQFSQGHCQPFVLDKAIIVTKNRMNSKRFFQEKDPGSGVFFQPGLNNI